MKPPTPRLMLSARPLADTPLARALYRTRMARHLNLREAATEAGLSTATFWRMEVGTKAPTVANLLKVAKWLGIEPFDLIN